LHQVALTVAGHGEKFTRRREAALAALLASSTVEKAAERCGVSYRTLKGWLAQEDFAREYRARRRGLLDDAVKVLQAAATAAVATLVTKLKAPKDADAIAAARLILEQAFKGTELLDLAGEVEKLREQVEVINNERNARKTG
jgi:hypothetical protein